MEIKAIIGLGNPGSRFDRTRHNIGFCILNQLAERHGGRWKTKDNMELAEIVIDDQKILLIKPQTFMNTSGQVVPYLTKQGIEASNLLVIHDELELSFGKIKFKTGGSAKGHNGLKSIMSYIGDGFHRLRFGIDRPESREDVSSYVLGRFTEPADALLTAVDEAADKVESLIETGAV